MRLWLIWIGLSASVLAQERPASSSVEPRSIGAESEREEIPACLGIVFKDGVAGTPEGHAIADMNYWISWGDYDLACVAYRMKHRKLEAPTVRFVHAWAQLKLAVKKKQGFDRSIAALEAVAPHDEAFRKHVAALLMSVREVAPCSICMGNARLRCTKCHGVGEIQSEACPSCEGGYVDCARCEAPKPFPGLSDIADSAPCDVCDGRGIIFRNVRWTCTECRGIGQKIVPKGPGSFGR